MIMYKLIDTCYGNIILTLISIISGNTYQNSAYTLQSAWKIVAVWIDYLLTLFEEMHTSLWL